MNKILIILLLVCSSKFVIGETAISQTTHWPDVTLYTFETGIMASNLGVKAINAFFESNYPGKSSVVDYPLKRVFFNLKHNPNHCAFGITANKEYLSIRPVLKMTYRIYRNSSTKGFETRELDSSIGSINTYGHERLTRKFTQSPVLINSRTKIVDMLVNNRVDYILELDFVVDRLLQNSTVTIVEDIIVEEAFFYFACSKTTDQVVVDWFTTLWDEGRKNKSIDKMYEVRGFLALLP